MRLHVQAGNLPARKVGKPWRLSRDAVARAVGAPLEGSESDPWADVLPGGGLTGRGMSTPEAAVFLRVRLQAVYWAAQHGRLPVKKVEGHWSFDREELLDWLSTGSAPRED